MDFEHSEKIFLRENNLVKANSYEFRKLFNILLKTLLFVFSSSDSSLLRKMPCPSYQKVPLSISQEYYLQQQCIFQASI